MTESTFRKEMSQLDGSGRPVHFKNDQLGPKKYLPAFRLLKTWIEGNLPIYKV